MGYPGLSPNPLCEEDISRPLNCGRGHLKRTADTGSRAEVQPGCVACPADHNQPLSADQQRAGIRTRREDQGHGLTRRRVGPGRNPLREHDAG